jgi:hypothetical protein
MNFRKKSQKEEKERIETDLNWEIKLKERYKVFNQMPKNEKWLSVWENRAHVVGGTTVQNPECLSHYATKAMIL